MVKDYFIQMQGGLQNIFSKEILLQRNISRVMKYNKCLSYPLSFYATQIINPFLNSRISDNQPNLIKGLFLYSRISFSSCLVKNCLFYPFNSYSMYIYITIRNISIWEKIHVNYNSKSQTHSVYFKHYTQNIKMVVVRAGGINILW